MSITPLITTGIKAIKVSKVDALGNNQNLQLKEANILRIKFDDLGVVDFTITDIAEYSTYYLYYVVPTQLGIKTASKISPNQPRSLSASLTPDTFLISGTHGPFINYQTQTGDSGSLTWTNASGIWTQGSNTGYPNAPYSIKVTCSFEANVIPDGLVDSYLYIVMSGSYTDPDTLITYPQTYNTTPLLIVSSSTYQPYTASFEFTPVSVYASNFGIWLAHDPTPGISLLTPNVILKTGSFNFTIKQFNSSSTDINGNSPVVIEPYTVYNVQNNDYNVIINNAVESRINDFYMDVDFASNAIIAVNQDQILNGTATRAQVQYSDYTMARITNPRYLGCKTTSPGFNTIPVTGSPIGQIPNIEQTVPYFIYTPGGRGNSLAERSGSGNYVIGFLVDENGDIYKPDSNTSSIYLSTIYNSFTSENPVVVTNINSSDFINATQSYTIYKPLVNSQTILHSDTGSLDQPYLVNGFYSAISMSLVPGVNTSVGVKANPTNPTQFNLLPGIETTASGFNTPLLNQANAFTASTGLYIGAQGYTPLRASITSSVSYDVNLPGGGPPNNTAVFLRIYKNGDEISSQSKTSVTGSSNQLLGVSSSIFLSPGDVFYVTIESTQVELDSYRFTNWELNPFTGSGGSGSIPLGSYYFTTGSNSRNVLTASADMSNFYGGNWQQKEILTNGTSSGFSSIQPFIINPLDEIRFEGNESQVALISSVNYSGPNNTLYLSLNRNIEPTEGININYFAIRRWIFSLDNLLINTPGTLVGPGLILPLYPTEKLKNNLSPIITQLQKDNLIA